MGTFFLVKADGRNGAGYCERLHLSPKKARLEEVGSLLGKAADGRLALDAAINKQNSSKKESRVLEEEVRVAQARL